MLDLIITDQLEFVKESNRLNIVMSHAQDEFIIVINVSENKSIQNRHNKWLMKIIFNYKHRHIVFEYMSAESKYLSDSIIQATDIVMTDDDEWGSDTTEPIAFMNFITASIVSTDTTIPPTVFIVTFTQNLLSNASVRIDLNQLQELGKTLNNSNWENTSCDLDTIDNQDKWEESTDNSKSKWIKTFKGWTTTKSTNWTSKTKKQRGHDDTNW